MSHPCRAQPDAMASLCRASLVALSTLRPVRRAAGPGPATTLDINGLFRRLVTGRRTSLICSGRPIRTGGTVLTASGPASPIGRWTNRVLPEAAAVAACVGGFVSGLWGILLLPSLIRVCLVLTVAVHGLGHALAGGDGARARLSAYLRVFRLPSLLPFGPLFVPGVSDAALAPAMTLAGLSSVRRRWVALAGPAANFAVLLVLAPSVEFASRPNSLADLALLMLAGLNLWVLATAWTDYRTLVSGVGGVVFCGNFGILAKRNPRERGFLPARFSALATRLGHATDIRGQQAGGIAVLDAGGRFIGRKVVNDKRGDLTRSLLRAFRWRAAWRRLFGARPLRRLFHLVAHYRYGTSSAPSEIETHWHRWLPARTVSLWMVDGQALVRRRRTLENLITHNGDFEAWTTPTRWLPNADLGVWLGSVLGTQNPARGDSPKIAGMMDLLFAQGQWEAALRLAYAMQTGQALSRTMLRALTRVFEQVFTRWAGGTIEPTPTLVGCTSLEDLYRRNPTAIQALLDALQQASLAATRDWPESAKPKRKRVVAQAMRAFFLNDLYRATQLFMGQAEGTFGLVATSSLEPGVIALASERQPLFVASDPGTGILLYASEAAALKSAWRHGADGEPITPVYRYDLCDGDVVLLRVCEDTADNTMTVTNWDRSLPPRTERITPEALHASAHDRGLGGWIALCQNPCVEPAVAVTPGRDTPDRVLAEMRDIPVVLDRIQREWDDPTSLNRRTAEAFSGALLHSACTGPTCPRAPGGPALSAAYDLLLLGIENNRALAERFAKDLRRVFPLLHVAAVDAVSYSEDPQRYPVGPSTVTLAISHSGQTFNTLDAVKFLNTLHGLNKAGPVFVMTGEIDTLMGAAVGQSVKAGAPWAARILTTGAGWRTAEPATVSAAATHATLTQLLLHLIRAAQTLCADDGLPYGLATSHDDLAKLDALARVSVARSAALFGRTEEGWDVSTAERDTLLREGRYLSRLLIEPALVFIFTALHLFVMLWLGWNPVIGLGQLLHAATGWAMFNPADGIGKVLSVVVQTAYFLFAGVTFTLLLRWAEERPLWDRLFVGRTLVIGDESYVKDLLAQYVSKLFSLAYEFAGFVGIHAADARSGELLHGYGHRITRGLVLFLGLPDGRWAGRERAEAAACMTSSQARGVRNMGAGAIVVGVGHNPASADKVDRFVLLGVSARALEDLPWVLRGDWSGLAKDLQESRFASFERLLAAYVIFHHAAARTRDFVNRLAPIANLLWAPIFWTVRLVTAGRVRPSFGRWDLARTQSGTRIATTASPVPAIGLDPLAYRAPAENRPALARTPSQPDPDAVAPEALAVPPIIDRIVQPCPRRFFQMGAAMPAPGALSSDGVVKGKRTPG